MSTTLSAKAVEFIDSVLHLKPAVAFFDCDGTLWCGDAGESFFSWELKRGIVSDAVAANIRARYAEYKVGNVTEDEMCGEMVTMHKGLRETAMLNFAGEFFNEKFVANIFPEMRELVSRLQKMGCDVWAVSSTNNWVIEAGMKHFNIPVNRILAASVEIENGTITDRLIRVPSGGGKPKAIREVAKIDPDVAFGNSRWDAEMLKIARHAFAVNPNSDLQTMAGERGWIVYWPDGTFPQAEKD
ncbi:MAG: Haloacid dehalogenase-like hydrolase [Acidobacteriaceae bacterium]|nr:Haloacid dehalogenase-like hydrolase [Acidobacteriaceae bacterium]